MSLNPLTHHHLGANAGAILALNNANTPELSGLTPSRLAHLVQHAFLACTSGAADALLIAFDQAADYDSPNFLWFRARYPRLIYIDRVVTAPAARGRGIARRLYEHLFAQAAAAGHTVIGCEVNTDPPNPVSDAFHAALGFDRVGAGSYGNKTVRYLTRSL